MLAFATLPKALGTRPKVRCATRTWRDVASSARPHPSRVEEAAQGPPARRNCRSRTAHGQREPWRPSHHPRPAPMGQAASDGGATTMRTLFGRGGRLYGLFEEEEECMGPSGARYLSSPKEREGGCVSCLLADLLTCAKLTQKGLCLQE